MMELPHFFGQICAQSYGNPQICHAVASATRINQGVGLCVLQQALARESPKDPWPHNSCVVRPLESASIVGGFQFSAIAVIGSLPAAALENGIAGQVRNTGEG